MGFEPITSCTVESVFTVKRFEKTKIKKKRPGMGQFEDKIIEPPYLNENNANLTIRTANVGDRFEKTKS